MTELEKLKEAACLIEDMTGCRFKYNMGGSFIYPDRDVYLALNMRKEPDYNAKLYRIHFDASLQTMGKPMDAAALDVLRIEVGRTNALLIALETIDYNLTPEEMQEFDDFIFQREEQEQEQGRELKLQPDQEPEQTQGPVMGQTLQ